MSVARRVVGSAAQPAPLMIASNACDVVTSRILFNRIITSRTRFDTSASTAHPRIEGIIAGSLGGSIALITGSASMIGRSIAASTKVGAASRALDIIGVDLHSDGLGAVDVGTPLGVAVIAQGRQGHEILVFGEAFGRDQRFQLESGGDHSAAGTGTHQIRVGHCVFVNQMLEMCR